MNANELTALISECLREIDDHEFFLKLESVLRQQQNEIEDLKSANRFIQNFAEEQHQRAVALESELDRAVELYTDKAIENEALKANRKHDFGLGEASGFIKGHKENPYQSITNTKIEPTVVSYTHPFNNNEPVGKVVQYDKNGSLEHAWFGEPPPVETLLYTHPVKEQDTDCQYCKQGCIRCDARKQLTDEEILEVWRENERVYPMDRSRLLDRTRACIRKAQEK